LRRRFALTFPLNFSVAPACPSERKSAETFGSFVCAFGSSAGGATTFGAAAGGAGGAAAASSSSLFRFFDFFFFVLSTCSTRL
jgi:hypothetical protein